MKYVYVEEEKINREIPDNVCGRRWAGFGFGALAVFFLIGGFFGGKEIYGYLKNLLLCHLVASPFLAGISFLFWFFARRTEKVIENTKTRTTQDILVSEKKEPFYSAQCGNCKVLIDYQPSDRAYRLWFIHGYIECPCCGKPIRHDEEKNRFIPYRCPPYELRYNRLETEEKA